MTTKPYHHDPDGGFRNPEGSPNRRIGKRGMLSFITRQLRPRAAPEVPDGHVLDRTAVDAGILAGGNPSVTWLGHAAFIVRTGGKVILTDPYLSERAGPAPLGPKRYVPPALAAHELPKADVMLVSHNHYDHLDAGVLAAYPHKDHTQVVVPLGLKRFFTRRGFKKVVEMDWWQSWSEDGLTITTLPAVHSSGRGLHDQKKTLWASFGIKTAAENVWFSGDTAHGDIFREIGTRHAPFDLALVGIGAYEPREIMKAVHATPEDAIQIARDIGAKRALGMHWGTIMLTPEDPFEAPARFRQAAIDQGYGAENALILKIGETRSLTDAA
ncbi:MBL fold metallo-hydrolase [Sneathiella sp.]|uniref:MBL fold metallo-hydrolase n=1 Tax=Sneathiella sp. TaxID=1964365 RepID=UPI002614F72E|nr:MBL fold metallo-hydrolase [Sneathiella sp.]MDF2366443.1 MBL fold metallo-hydrolase [Sneathiella sp.]